jgi:hypothetical protein
MNNTAVAETTWNDGLDDLVARGIITRIDNWKLGKWAEWFGGWVEDAYHASQEEISHAEFMVRPDGHIARNVREATAASYSLGYDAPAKKNEVPLDVLALEECECLLRQHIHILHHRARLERLAPLYWNWVRSMDDLTDEQCTLFADEFMVALLEVGSEEMAVIFHTNYSRDALLDYILGKDEE